MLERLDAIAERATTLGSVALGTARMAASASTLDEYPLDTVAGIDTLKTIADRLAAYGASIPGKPGRARSDSSDLKREREPWAVSVGETIERA